MSLYHLIVTVHVLTALLWLGGMFFLAVVGAPVLRGASRLRPGTPGMLVLRRRAAWLARSSAVFGVVVVIAAVRLARGG